MSGGSATDDDQFLLRVHVVEVTATVVVVVDVVDVVLVVLLLLVVVLEVVVVVAPNVGNVVVGTDTLFGQYFDG